MEIEAKGEEAEREIAFMKGYTVSTCSRRSQLAGLSTQVSLNGVTSLLKSFVESGGA